MLKTLQKSDLSYVKERSSLTKRILKWYDSNKASYPWRGNCTPYQILITEMLLRKTTRGQVKELFPVFFRKFPSVTKLATANKKEVEKVIRPLGMEKIRSKLLVEVAKTIVKKHNGMVPNDKTSLLNLPGVGEYIANAVLLLSMGEKVALVDTNSKRIVERLFLGDHEPQKRVNKEVSDQVFFLVPEKRFVDFNLALLDFASSVCLPRKPKCPSCTLKKSCAYYKNHY